MSSIPLDQLGWRWRDHKAALWWLGLLYRRPNHFRQAAGEHPFERSKFIGIKLWAHFLPYLVLICVLGRFFVFGALGLPPYEPLGGLWDAFYFHSTEIVSGITVAIAATIAAWFGIICAAFFAFAIKGDIGGDRTIAYGLGGGLGGMLATTIAVGLAVGISGGLAGGLTAGIAIGIAVGIAFGISILRLYYYPFHILFVWPRIRPDWYPYHPVAWDDLCGLPFFKLDHLLVAYAEHTPRHGIAEIERLIDRYRSQRMAALRARVRLLARQSARLPDLTKLNALMAQLPEGERGFLSQTAQVREMVRGIAELQIRLNVIDRPSCASL